MSAALCLPHSLWKVANFPLFTEPATLFFPGKTQYLIRLSGLTSVRNSHFELTVEIVLSDVIVFSAYDAD